MIYFMKLRKWLAGYLVMLANKIDPENEEVMNFWVRRMTDLVISGKSTIKIIEIPSKRDCPKK